MIILKKLLASLCAVTLCFAWLEPTCFAAEKQKKNLFFYWEYKMPCTIAIALNRPEEINDIAVRSPLEQDKIDKLKKIFKRVYLLYEQNDKNEFFENKDSYDRVFSCVVHRNVQIYFGRNKKYYRFEDGSADYMPHKRACWKNNYQGIQQVFLLYPEYRVSAFKNIPAEAISRENYLKAIELFFEPKPLKGKIIYCSEEPAKVNQTKNKKMLSILKKYDDVLIKTHPRDRTKYLWPNNFTILKDHTQPFESYYYGFNGILISDLSSCLYTSKFMKPDAPVICTAFLDGQAPAQVYTPYVEMLKKLNVMFPKTTEELNKMISQNINKI